MLQPSVGSPFHFQQSALATEARFACVQINLSAAAAAEPLIGYVLIFIFTLRPAC